MHVLTVCERGNVRSHSCAQILRDYAMIDDVIAMGVNTASLETITYMAEWADLILIMGDVVPVDRIAYLVGLGDKTIRLEIGPDVWLKAMHPHLVRVVIEELNAKTALIQQTRWPYETYLTLIDQAYMRVS